MHSLRHLSRQLNGFGRTRSPDSPPASARQTRPTSLLCPSPPAPRPEPSHLVRLARLVCTKLTAAWAALRSRPGSFRQVPSDSARRNHFGVKTLVLDLDETLIHSTSRPIPSRTSFFPTTTIPSPAHTVDVVLAGRHAQYHVYKRPFVDFFLRTVRPPSPLCSRCSFSSQVSGWYTLVIFTASMKEYADPVIDWLDAGRGILVQRLFRDVCSSLSFRYPLPYSPCPVLHPATKRLIHKGSIAHRTGSFTSLPRRQFPHQLQRQSRSVFPLSSYTPDRPLPANGIPIEGWTDDPSDQALLDLLPVLDSLRFTKDVRHILGLRSAGLYPPPS